MSSEEWPPSYPPPASSRPLRGRVLDALLDEGLRPDVDADGDVAFTLRGQRLFVRCVDPDPDLDPGGGAARPDRLRGRVPLARVFGQWHLGDSVPADPLLRLRAANDITARYDLVKASLHDDVLLVLVDLVVVDAADDAPLRPLLTGAAAGVLSAVRAWYAAAGGHGPGGAGAGTPGAP
ncbi:hypothetical protein [Quadrisphaera sp. DSM 44207]|uniref:hypothetical protein n=1 Tax=Quadrisphaera sp. DSM 44207 TaxID=1881057 RepID=UPI00088AD32E|nr:hypothetical protein [Quadrisphaera sp. DSM 44207]SDQ74198.1 hypothetical protein SAMN05428996_2626 [Quadrisphaera sp. DSM 44207]